MSKTANDIRVGNIIEHQGKNWRVLKTDHVKPGKGGAFVQVELKEIKQGTKLNERFRSTETINTAHSEEKEYQYLFSDGNFVTVMDNETYEQTEIDVALLEGKENFLQDGINLTLYFVADEIISARPPVFMTFEVTESEPVVKGQTAASSSKPAILENGVKVMVPPFVEMGDKIVINTEELTYIKRSE